MNTIKITVLTTMFSFTNLCPAAPGVRITADVPDNLLNQRYAKGDVVPVTFSVSSAGAEGVFGAELDIRTKGRKVRIRSVSVNPAFAATHEDTSANLPARQLTIARSQAVESLDRTLGANGASVPFATVELEMLTNLPFAAAVDVEARAALIGKAPETVNVLGMESQNRKRRAGRNRSSGRLAVLSGKAIPENGNLDDAMTNHVPWTYDSASITLAAYQPGGSQPVTAVTAGQTYELRYDAGQQDVNGYILFTAAPTTTQRLATVAVPSTGPWSNNDEFVADLTHNTPEADMSVVGLATGYEANDMISNVREASRETALNGTLFTFTPAEAGELNFALTAWSIDETNVHQTDLETKLTLVVVAGR